MLNPKDTPFDHLQNEIVREKFSALRRITENLSNCLKTLEDLDRSISEAISENLSSRHINRMIDAYNRVREDAEEWRYYLIVTREAAGLFHHNLSAGVYRIPPRKAQVGL